MHSIIKYSNCMWRNCTPFRKTSTRDILIDRIVVIRTPSCLHLIILNRLLIECSCFETDLGVRCWRVFDNIPIHYLVICTNDLFITFSSVNDNSSLRFIWFDFSFLFVYDSLILCWLGLSDRVILLGNAFRFGNFSLLLGQKIVHLILSQYLLSLHLLRWKCKESL
jgi:hypothetical protein